MNDRMDELLAALQRHGEKVPHGAFDNLLAAVRDGNIVILIVDVRGFRRGISPHADRDISEGDGPYQSVAVVASAGRVIDWLHDPVVLSIIPSNAADG